MSPRSLKLKLLYKRAEKDRKSAVQRAADAWFAYLEQMRAEGLCANCEKSLAECKCVFAANGSQGWSLTSVADVQSIDGMTATRL